VFSGKLLPSPNVRPFPGKILAHRYFRLLGRLPVLVLTLVCVGCTSTSVLSKKVPTSFGQSAKEQALRKQVDSDSFPTAKQAGL